MLSQEWRIKSGKLKNVVDKMQKSYDHLLNLYRGINDGSVDPHLLDGIRVECYENKILLRELCFVSIQGQSLLVRPYDVSIINDIQKAIVKSELGLNPQKASTTLLVPIPRLYQNQREKYIKYAKKLAEEAKISIRNIRRKALKDLPDQKKKIEEMTKEAIAKIEDLFDLKKTLLRS